MINKSSPEPLICSYPNSFSHLSKKWLHVIVFRPLHGSLGNTGKVKHLNINRSNEQQNGRTSFKFTGCSIISSLLCLINSVKSQSQLIKHVLTNPSRQLSVKQARLPLGSKNTSVQICQLHKKNPLLTSGFPPLGNTMIFEKTKKCMQ